MDYQCIENERTGELRIIISGGLLELSRCARTMLNITEGLESAYLKSKFSSDKLSCVNDTETVGIGNNKQELFSYSKNGLEYCFLPDGHPKTVVDAAKNHYMVIKIELENLMKYYHGKPGSFDKQSRDVDYYG
jgi:hypothetical protein